MKYRLQPLLVLTLLGGAPMSGRTDEALANERPPMTPAALERHWGVDCNALSARLLAWTGTPAQALPADWPQQLKLCAAVHNPPGDPAVARCPDFAGVARVLQAAANDTTTTTESIRRLLTCVP